MPKITGASAGGPHQSAIPTRCRTPLKPARSNGKKQCGDGMFISSFVLGTGTPAWFFVQRHRARRPARRGPCSRF